MIIFLVAIIQAIMIQAMMWVTVAVGEILLAGIFLTLFGIGIRAITHLTSVYCPKRSQVIVATSIILFFVFLG